MFRLSDATRRLVTTGLFVLLCVVPTVVVMAIGLWRCLPGRTAAEERRLSLLLGQPVRLESVRYLRPDAARYGGVEVLDPETGKVLLQCDQLHFWLDAVRYKGDKTDHSRLRVSANRLTVVAHSFDAFRPLAERLLQRRIEEIPPLTLLEIERLVLKNPACEFPVRADVALQPQESNVELRFLLEGQTKPVSLRLARNRSHVPPVDGFLLQSGDDGPVPCSILSKILPPFPELGPNSKFQGVIGGNHVPEGCRRLDGQRCDAGWELGVRGCLLDIDLQKLVADHLPHDISGTGSLQLERLKVSAGRISEMKGSLHARNGRISRELVASCVRELNLTTTFPIGGSTPFLVYDELAAGFLLEGRGFHLWGECPSEPAGALMVGGYTHRLDGPPTTGGPIAPTKVIAALTSTPELQLSTSPHASALVRRVPFISTAPVAVIAAPPLNPRTPVRQ